MTTNIRIASLQPSISLIVHALGRAECLCGVTKYCIEALPELSGLGLAVLQDSWTGNTEQIRALRPDLVVASVPYRMESLAAILKAGFPVLALAPKTLFDIYADVRLIARAVEAAAAGEILVERMKHAIAEVRCKAVQAARPLVYCEEWGKPLIRSQGWVAELVEACGGRFLGRPGGQATQEELVEANPDVMLFAWCGSGNRVPLERVVAKRNWQSMAAVQSRRVFCIPDQYLNTPGPTLLEGLACIAYAVQPQLFPVHKELIRLKAPAG